MPKDAKHTAGPWVVSTRYEDETTVLDSDGFILADTDDMLVLEGWSDTGAGHWSERPGETCRAISTEEAKANTRLIASAPELLEAAKHAAMEWRLHGQLTDSCRVLEAAIAKATEVPS